MNEVYISWETSVKRAYDRYGAVIERCMSGQSQRRESVIQEEFFVMLDNITDDIMRFRSIPAELKESRSKTRERWIKIKEKLKRGE